MVTTTSPPLTNAVPSKTIFMAQNNSTLNGKKVLIPGGSSGLGLATAKAAATEGAILTIVSANRQRIDEALQHLHGSATGITIDLSQEKYTTAVQTIRQLRPPGVHSRREPVAQ
jgi:NAD(P)-dependent dehydrogenase (short-subunit alcohol dehydrogenase family)